MIAEEVYKFPRTKYNDEGINIENGSFFLDSIREWEKDFHKKYRIYFSNYIFANSSTMILFDKCLDLKKNQHCGMDLIDGQIDLDTNLEIEKHSATQTIFAIESKFEKRSEEPLFLVCDDMLSDGMVVLKFISDDDWDEDEEDKDVPVEFDLFKMN